MLMYYANVFATLEVIMNKYERRLQNLPHYFIDIYQRTLELVEPLHFGEWWVNNYLHKL